MTVPASEWGNLSDLLPDGENPRAHPERNIELIERSLRELGASRSIVVDEHQHVLAGNGTLEAAARAGITRVRFIDADGNEIIAVRRRNLTPEQKRLLALYDNRSAELAEWNVIRLSEMAQEMNLRSFFSDGELMLLLGQLAPNAGPPGGHAHAPGGFLCPECGLALTPQEEQELFGG